jgi:UDP-N-acetylmuramoyl-tripeptide--D-alanyl-D-alanine ligase
MPMFDGAGAARVTGGALEGRGGGRRVARVTIDSREAGEGDLFVALPGSKTNGTEFVADAMRRGAAVAIVPLDAPPLAAEFADRVQIRVKYPKKALADLAAAHRRSLKCPVIGVTGSNGKSSTREMIAKVLEPLGPVVQSIRSFNNDLGVPLTILRADENTAALIVEMGTSARGEIAQLCGIARPTVGVVTNVGAAHLEGLGSEDGVATEKAALPRSIPGDGYVILNADDARVAAMADRTLGRVVTYGLGVMSADVWGTGDHRTPRGMEVWLYGKMPLFVPVPGRHNVSNAMAAVAVGMVHGIDPATIRVQLRGVRLPSLRMQRVAFRGVTLFLDCYNANPASLAAAVDELSTRPTSGRRILVVGDMLELGPRSAELHHAAGLEIGRRVDVLWCVGTASRALMEGALESGLHPENAFWSATPEHAMSDPAVAPTRGDVVLLKASRGMRLERLADTLRRARVAAATRRAEVSGDVSGEVRRVG